MSHCEAALWGKFRHFAGSSFHSAKDLIKQVKEQAGEKVDGNEEAARRVVSGLRVAFFDN